MTHKQTIQILVCTVVLCLGERSSAQAQSYATWQAAHPNAELEIANLKAQTAALIDKYSTEHQPPIATAAVPLYRDLLERSRTLSGKQRRHAADLLKISLAQWSAQNFVDAEAGFKDVLAIDPANADANYYYADCLVRRRKTSSGAEFMNRAAIFGAGSKLTEQANTALSSVPPAPGLGPPPTAGGPPSAGPPAGARPPGAPGPGGGRGMGPPQPLLTLRQQIPPAADPRTMQPPIVWTVAGAITEIRDCADCPVMTIVPAGEFNMGSPATEAERDASEGPLHRVTIAYPFAVGTYPVMRGEYAQFVADTKWPDPEECIGVAPGSSFPIETKGLTWHSPGIPQSDRSAVVCVNWKDAAAYVEWLSKKTGHVYRLLSEAEYEYADRAGTTTAYWWGDAIGTGKANCGGCGGPVSNQTLLGPLAANPFGLYDMNGNIWEMVADCYHDDYAGAPTDGSAWMSGPCQRNVLKGGSFVNTPDYVRSAVHFRVMSELANHSFLGFRVARTL